MYKFGGLFRLTASRRRRRITGRNVAFGLPLNEETYAEVLTSRTSGLPIVFGFTLDGRYIMVVYEQIDAITVYPVTAYDVDE